MAYHLRYGASSEITLDLPEESVLLDRSCARTEPIVDVSAAVADALANPLEFPPVADAIVPGDEIAIALAGGVPQPSEVVAGVIDALLAAGAATDQICVVTSSVPDDFALHQKIEIVLHEPNERTKLSFVAPGANDEAVYFNRRLADADVVISVGPVVPAAKRGVSTPCVNLYPEFADSDAKQRFASAGSSGDSRTSGALQEAVVDAVWRLGAMLFVQVVPGMGDSIVDVLAGQAAPLATVGQSRCDEEWSITLEQPAALTVAAVEGGRQQQTWSNLAKALEIASQTTIDNGSIALVCELRSRPGASLLRLAGEVMHLDDATALVEDDDTEFAAQLDRLGESYRIFLLSDLEEDLVESLGMAFVSNGAEIARLASRHETCALIGGAQFVAIAGQTATGG